MTRRAPFVGRPPTAGLRRAGRLPARAGGGRREWRTRQPPWWLVGLLVSVTPPLAGGLFFADRYAWVPAELAPAPARLWTPRPRPETAAQRLARVAKIRAELRRLATDWAAAVRQHRTETFVWRAALRPVLSPRDDVPAAGQVVPADGLRRLAVKSGRGTAVLTFDAGWQYHGPGQPFSAPGGRWASGPRLGDPRYAALSAACAGGVVGSTFARTYQVTITAGRGAAVVSATRYYACAWQLATSAPTPPQWLNLPPSPAPTTRLCPAGWRP